MKEIYYGRIPLGVPIQKRPPNKYASHTYPVLVDEEMVISASMRGKGYTIRAIVDNLDVVASITGVGVLKSHYVPPPEPIILQIANEDLSAFAKISGNGELWKKPAEKLPTVLNLGVEEVSISSRMTGSGKMKSNIIFYDREVDNMKVSATMKGNGELI